VSALPAVRTAAAEGLLLCDVCDLLNRPANAAQLCCARCGANLHLRRPDALRRAWAFLIAATILYIPANTLPIMHSGSLYGVQSDTILSGVVWLYQTGSWGLALIVFVASVVVPLAKIGSLAFLLLAAQRESSWDPLRRARLFRVTHWIGRWSMVDIYVGACLVALVQFKAFASIEPGEGAIAFGLVVVLTMLATASFDPRLTWDPVDRPEAAHA
jgi:paraquat-inducible protein A